MESTPGDNFPFMPAPVPAPLIFRACPVCTSPKGPLPKFISPSDGSIMRISDFKARFAAEKWQPILVARSMKIQAFEELTAPDPDYGWGFKYDWDVESQSYFIVDGASILHESLGGRINFRIGLALMQQYEDPVEDIFDFTGAGNIYESPTSSSYRAPDASVAVASQVPPLDPSKARLPFLVVETAVSQSSQSLQEKVDYWIRRKIPYVIAVDRVAYQQAVRNAQNQGFVEISVWGPNGYFQSVKIPLGEEKPFEFVLSKAVITAGYDLSAYDLHPETDEMKITLLQYFAK